MIRLLITNTEIVAQPHGLPEVCICHYEATVVGHKLHVTQYPVTLQLVLNYSRPFVPNSYDFHFMGVTIKNIFGSAHTPEARSVMADMCFSIIRERFEFDTGTV